VVNWTNQIDGHDLLPDSSNAFLSLRLKGVVCMFQETGGPVNLADSEQRARETRGNWDQLQRIVFTTRFKEVSRDLEPNR